MKLAVAEYGHHPHAADRRAARRGAAS